MKIDLKGMNRRELTTLSSRIEKALQRLEKADKKKALEAAEAAARQHGFSLSDLTDGGKPRAKPGPKPKGGRGTGTKSAPKYANPDDASITWTGRGRRPDWIKKALAQGKSLADFEIG